MKLVRCAWRLWWSPILAVAFGRPIAPVEFVSTTGQRVRL